MGLGCPVCGAANAACGPAHSKGVYENSHMIVMGNINEAPEMLVRIGEITMEETGEYTSNRRLYLDKDGKVVDENDPNRLTLLVAENGTMPMGKAREYGLINEEAEGEGASAGGATDAEETGDKVQSMTEGKAVDGPPENKARTSAAKKVTRKVTRK